MIILITGASIQRSFFIDHIRLFPRNVHGVEIINAGRKDEENELAKTYAKYYNLIEFAGSDKHSAAKKGCLAGMCSETPIADETEFIEKVKNREMTVFKFEFEG